MIDFNNYWGQSQEALSCSYNPDHRGKWIQWMHTDNPDNYNPETTKYRPEEFGYGMNSYGWRGPEPDDIIADPTDVILYVGDSFTYGIGCPYEHTWAYKLHEALCIRDNTPYKYLNISSGGASEAFMARMLSNWKPVVKPIAVFLMMPEPTRSEVFYPETDWLQRHGASFPLPHPHHSDKMFGLFNPLAERWKTFHQARIDSLVDENNQYFKYSYYMNTISALLADTPWYWQTWDIVFRRQLEQHDSLLAGQRDHMLPHRLPNRGVQVAEGWYTGSGRDSAHTGLAESIEFVDKNLPFIGQF